MSQCDSSLMIYVGGVVAACHVLPIYWLKMGICLGLRFVFAVSTKYS